MKSENPIRVLYSFPHKIGAARICYTAWQQVYGLVLAGVDVTVYPGAIHRPFPVEVKIHPTLAKGPIRLPYKLLGAMRTLALHDYIVSKRLPALVGKIDLVHAWPSASLQTLKVARKLGIPTVIERPNAHTRYAYQSVQAEAKRIGVTLPPDNEYAMKLDVLEREEQEFELADFILCPSDFTMKTFRDFGFSSEKLVKHGYGFDEERFYPMERDENDSDRGITMFFAGDCAVRKGVHFALEAWLDSPASRNGQFLIAGNILPDYARAISPMISHPSVKVLGHRSDVPELMRASDVFVLPSIEEGYGLVCAEAIGSGCVPLVSEACTDICRHMENSLVHKIGDVSALKQHITMLHEDRALLKRLRLACINGRSKYTWKAAGHTLKHAYSEAVSRYAGVTGEHRSFVSI